MKAILLSIIVFLLSGALLANETYNDSQIPVSSEIQAEKSQTRLRKIVEVFMSVIKKIPYCFGGADLGGGDFGGADNAGKFDIINNAIAHGILSKAEVTEMLKNSEGNIDLVDQDILKEIKKYHQESKTNNQDLKENK